MIDVFVSHSSQDAALAAALVDLLRTALNLRAEQIRCTSVDGYRLPVGADSDEQLRTELMDATAFVGILSPFGISSTYVLFELGARWGAKRHIAPLLAQGLTPAALRGPIAGLNALSCGAPAQLHQLVHDLAKHLHVTPDFPATYQSKIDALVYSSVPESIRGETGSPTTSESIQRPEAKAGKPSEYQTEYPESDAIIQHHCETEWPDDFSMQAYCIRQQRNAVQELRKGCPLNISPEVFARIRKKCTVEWPDDYAMRVYCETQQVAGYRMVSRK